MVEIPLLWKLGVSGAEEVTQRLEEITEQYNRGQISLEQYTSEMKRANSDFRTLANTTAFTKNQFLALHPAIGQLSRTVSVFSSISHSALSITNALNLMFIRQQGQSSELADAKHELAAAQRDLNRELAKAVPDMEKVADAQERINIATAKIDEIMKGETMKKFTDFLTAIGSAFGGIAIAILVLQKIGPALTGIGEGLTAISSTGIIAGLISFFAAIPAAAQALPFFVTQLIDALIPGLAEWHKWWIDKGFRKTFTEDLPKFLGQAGLFLTNFFLNDLPNWAGIGWTAIQTAFITTANGIIVGFNSMISGLRSGLESFINGVISALNRLISAFNSRARIFRVRIQTIPSISIPGFSIPLIAAATGFEGVVNRPTMFLAGEAGSESVSIRPRGAGGGPLVIQVFVQGSMITEKELYSTFNDRFKEELKRRGWSGL